MVCIYKNASVSGGLPQTPCRGFAPGPHWGTVSPRPPDSFCSAPLIFSPSLRLCPRTFTFTFRFESQQYCHIFNYRLIQLISSLKWKTYEISLASLCIFAVRCTLWKFYFCLTTFYTVARAVLTPTDGSCYVFSRGDVRTSLLSSLLTRDTACGSPQMPWIVEVQPGQQINFTLIDFTSPSNASQHSSRCRSSSRRNYRGRVCIMQRPSVLWHYIYCLSSMSGIRVRP